jgi:hypothetical protein
MDCGIDCVQVGVNEGFENKQLDQHYNLEEIYTFDTTFSLKLLLFQDQIVKMVQLQPSPLSSRSKDGHNMAASVGRSPLKVFHLLIRGLGGLQRESSFARIAGHLMASRIGRIS